MAVIVKREGVRMVATLPRGEWTLRNWHGRIVAFSPDHPPLILGEDGMTLKAINLSFNGKCSVNLDRFGNVSG